MGVTGRRTVPWQAYGEYINSPDWRATRQRYLDSKLPKECFGCFAPWQSGFHFHHRTYKNLGAEKLSDIVPMCPGCHAMVHTLQRQKGLDLWTATKRVRGRSKKAKKWLAVREQQRQAGRSSR